MDIDKARELLRSNHRAVFFTRRADGSPQLSPVVCCLDDSGAVIVSTRQTAMKAKNVARDPRVALCVFGEGFFGAWLQVEGSAEVIALPEAMDLLVEYYRSLIGEHPDWDEYREAMRSEQRVIIRIPIERAGPDVAG